VPRRGRTEQALEALAALERTPGGLGAHLAELRKALSHASSLVVARAARLAGKAGLTALADDLEAAFLRLCDAAPTADPGCSAKKALAEALDRLEHQNHALFRRGLRYVQNEAVHGGRVDTAAALRAACAFALVRLRPPGVVTDVALLLADRDPTARASSARAMAALGGEAAEALLCLRMRLPEAEPAVLGEYALALLRSSPSAGLEAAEELLFSSEPETERGEAVALALAESRQAGAVCLLRRLFEHGFGERRRLALRALALLRNEEAFDFLVKVVRDGGGLDARAALHALGAGGIDGSLTRRLEQAIRERDEPELAVTLRDLLGR
jgi:hypothetical protein